MSFALFFACVISVLMASMVKADVSNQDGKVESESRAMTEEGADVMHSSNRRKRSDDLGAVEATLSMLSQKVNQQEAALQATDNKIGSTFIRWGRTQCPSNTQLVYSGFSGGKHVHEEGSGTNRLCLSTVPQFDSVDLPGAFGHLYGTEYFDVAGLHGHDAPCAVCRTPLSTTITVPGTLTCPQGWTTQYKGHIMSTHFSADFATEYVCVDENPIDTNRPGSDALQWGNFFEYIATVCGSLPCPPYENNRVVTCVVCSL